MRIPAKAKFLALTMLATVSIPFTPGIAHVQENDATRILKQMSDYLAGQHTIAATFDAGIEVVTNKLEKIQFNSSGELLLVRPDKLRVSRTGGISDIELTFDGRTATIFGKNLNTFAQADIPGSTDELLDRIRNEYGIQQPGTDLLLSDVFAQLTKDVVEAKYVGGDIIGGIECEHLAFRNDDTDWQLWVQTGPQPIPRKLVITSKATVGAPQYTLLIREWRAGASAAPGSFGFTAPVGAKKLEFKEFAGLSDIDEVPYGVETGGE
jgi:hypothetical protein